MNNLEPLKFPSHYPPTEKWKKFFIGVRWLGPDLSFFSNLRKQQSLRNTECMQLWGTDWHRRKIANVCSDAFHHQVGWPSKYFIPLDEFAVVMSGPSFDAMGDAEFALFEIEDSLQKRLPDSFCQEAMKKNLGEVVDQLIVETSKGL